MPLRDLADLERRIRRLEMGVDQSRHKLVVPERTVSVAPPLGAGDVPYVDLSTDQNVAGVKTFVAFPVTPSSAPTTDYQVANKKYVDDNIGGGVTDHGALTGLADNDHPQYLLTTGKAADSDKLDGIDSTGFVKIDEIGTWLNWTPTVTFAGGTTDPSSTTLQYARYTQIGKTVIATADYLFGKGGNRTQYQFTLPLTPAQTYGAVTGYESLKTAFTDPTKASLAASGALVTVYVPVQDKAGHVMFTAVYEVA